MEDILGEPDDSLLEVDVALVRCKQVGEYALGQLVGICQGDDLDTPQAAQVGSEVSCVEAPP
ncbi:hypothetical protein SAMN03159489_03346 [Pseudomonas sp. NFPP07]|nr:hypothetical protein SAMN03159489_03346 [Pseudomonas sp. NFPP07]